MYSNYLKISMKHESIKSVKHLTYFFWQGYFYFYFSFFISDSCYAFLQVVLID